MAYTMCGRKLLLNSKILRPAARQISSSPTVCVQRSVTLLKVETMKQVDVDESEVQKRLGSINMDFVRKAERKNKERANMHKFFRRTDWMIAATCFAIVGGIYGYTMFAIQQEKFLDDFEMPEEIDKTEEKN